MSKGKALADLAGEVAEEVLEGAQAAVNDLQDAGITAKDADSTDAVTDPDQPATGSMDKDTPTPAVDLVAMRDEIERLKQSAVTPDDTELVQLREQVNVLQSQLDDLKTQMQAQTQAQTKDAGDRQMLQDRLAAVTKEQGLALEVLGGLYELVMGVHSGERRLVVERDGKGSAHDPEGKKLQQQVEQALANAPKTGEYAAATVFGSN